MPWISTAFFDKMIYIFNPETDFALGHNRRFYTPSKTVSLFRERFALLPSILASPGDRILIDNPSSKILSELPFFPLLKIKNIEAVSIKDLELLTKETRFSSENPSAIKLSPWGWNRALLHYLNSNGVNKSILPDEGFIDSLRALSHRNMTTLFLKENGSKFPNILAPSYLTSKLEIEKFAEREERFVLKAPWSSSGRGVVISTEMDKEKLLEWASGAIRSQGGVMGERLYDVKLNFASEWIIENGEPLFLGLSLFKTSGRGKYKGNLLIPQEEITKLLKAESDWSDIILELQKDFIKRWIAPQYRGPLGIDMLVTSDGDIDPCVEINIRYTMGHVAIKVEEGINSNMSETGDYLRNCFPDGLFNLDHFFK